jgi:hypothetical protein
LEDRVREHMHRDESGPSERPPRTQALRRAVGRL